MIDREAIANRIIELCNLDSEMSNALRCRLPNMTDPDIVRCLRIIEKTAQRSQDLFAQAQKRRAERG